MVQTVEQVLARAREEARKKAEGMAAWEQAARAAQAAGIPWSADLPERIEADRRFDEGYRYGRRLEATMGALRRVIEAEARAEVEGRQTTDGSTEIQEEEARDG